MVSGSIFKQILCGTRGDAIAPKTGNACSKKNAGTMQRGRYNQISRVPERPVELHKVHCRNDRFAPKNGRLVIMRLS